MSYKPYTSAELFELINNRLCERFNSRTENSYMFDAFHVKANVCNQSVEIRSNNWLPVGVLRFGDPSNKCSYLDIYVEGVIDESGVSKKVLLGCYKIYDDDFEAFRNIGQIYSEFIRELIAFRENEWKSEVSD